MTKPRLGKRNPLDLFQESENENQDSRFRKTDSGIPTQETQNLNPEASEALFSLSVRIKESLNDGLDTAVKVTRRNRGKKIRKEVMVALALELMMAKVEKQGGWQKINSEESLRKILGI